jgi:Flp pilus assembly protein TadB
MGFIILSLSLFLTLLSHLGARQARVRAQQHYADIMASFENHQKSHETADRFGRTDAATSDSFVGQTWVTQPPTHDLWCDLRPFVGVWGCLFLLFVFLRGAALLLSIGAAFWLLFGG